MPAVVGFEPFRKTTTLRDEMNRPFSRSVGDGAAAADGSAGIPSA